MDVTAVPAPVCDALVGRPAVGDWDPMFPLLTVDEAGFPQVCQLGRTELDTDDTHIYAVLAGATTISNLHRTGTATLVVVSRHIATSCKLQTVGDPIRDGRHSGFAFRVVATKHDSAGVLLREPRFLVSEAVTVAERWTTVAALLAELRRRTAADAERWAL